MEKFVYVFTEQARDALFSAQYHLIASKRAMFIFENRSDRAIPLTAGEYVLSDTLTF